jgi:hypothetical protein
MSSESIPSYKQPFNLHLLFDAYIADNIGNTRLDALESFRYAFQLFFDNNRRYWNYNLLDLLKTSIEIETVADIVVKASITAYDKFLQKTDYPEKKYISYIQELIDSINEIPPTQKVDQFKKKISTHEVLLKYTEGDKPKEFMEQQIRIILNAFINVFYADITEIILPAGYRTKEKETGHLVGIYINQKEKKVVIANSGNGIRYHREKKEQNLYEIIVEKTDFSNFDYDIGEIAYQSYLARGIFDRNYDVDKFYTNAIIPFFGNLVKSTVDNEKFYHPKQLSGSCTFFGLYYLFYYYYLNNLIVFDAFTNFTKLRVTDEIISDLDKETTLKPEHKDFIDLLFIVAPNKNTELNTLLNKYNTSIENTTSKYVNNIEPLYTHRLAPPSSRDIKMYPTAQYIKIITEASTLTTISDSLDKVLELLNNIAEASNKSGLEWITNMYLTERILNITYNKDTYSNNNSQEEISNIINKAKAIMDRINEKLSNRDTQLTIFRREKILYFILLNIVIKVNRLTTYKFLIETEFKTTDHIIQWINSNFSSTKIDGQPYAKNLQNYQNYILAYDFSEKGLMVNDTMIKTWSKHVQEKVSNEIPINMKDIDLDLRDIPNQDYVLAYAKHIVNFLHVLEDNIYKTIFELFIRVNSSYATIEKFFKSLIIAKQENKIRLIQKEDIYTQIVAYDNYFLNPNEFPHLEKLSFMNYFNIVELVNNISSDALDQVFDEITKGYDFNIQEDNRKREENIDESHAVIYTPLGTTDLTIDEFDSHKGYMAYKCELNTMDPQKLSQLSAKVLSKVLLLDLFCAGITINDANIIKRLEFLINETELITLKLVYTIIANSNKYLYDIVTIFHKSNNKDKKDLEVYYHILMIYLVGLNDTDKLNTIVMTELIDTSYSNKFVQLMKKNNYTLKLIGPIDDKSFGAMIQYQIIETGKIINLIDNAVFSNLAYNYSDDTDRLHEKYYYYQEFASESVIAISNDDKLELDINGDNYLVINSNNFYKQATQGSTVGTLTSIILKFYKITKTPISVWHHNATNTYKVDIIDYNIAFKIDNNTQKVYFNNYEVIMDPASLAYNIWIHGLDNAFLLLKDNKYKILLLDKYYKSTNEEDKIFPKSLINADTFYKSIWLNTEKIQKEYNKHIYTEFSRPIYHIIDFHYTCMYLIFNSEQSFRSYVLYAAIAGKTNCLYVHHNQYMQYFVNSSRKFDYLSHFFANNPYKFYFLYKMQTQLYDLLPNEYYTFDIYHNFGTKYHDRGLFYPNKYIFSQGVTIQPPTELTLSTYEETLKKLQKTLIRENNFVFDKQTIQDINAIDKRYATYVATFTSDYKDCQMSPGGLESTDINTLKERFKNKYDLLLKILVQSFDSSTNTRNLSEYICEHATTFYLLIEHIKLLRITEAIENICIKGVCECQEIRKLRDILDSEVVYTGPRTVNLVLFEILFGSIIRKDQHRIYLQIIDDTQINIFKIHQMLMGEGKTSVLAPLLVLHYSINTDNPFANVISIMPEHLTKQSYDNLIVNYSPILENCNVIKLTVDRQNNKDLVKFFKDEPTSINILIMDDNSFKSLRLNEIEFEPQVTELIQKQSIIIIDEIDSILNPLSSDLNYPIDYTQLNPFITELCTWLIKNTFDTIKNNKSFTTQKDSKDFINKYFKELNYALPYANEFKYFVDRYINNVKTNPENINFTYVGIIRKVYTTLIAVFMLVYRKDYGFGRKLENFHKNNMIAIPYKAVDDPIDKSEYTDADLTICLTTLTYYYNGLRTQDLEEIVTYIVKSVQKYKSIKLIEVTHKSLKDILAQYNFTFTDIIGDHKKNFINSINKLKFDYNLIDMYLKLVIIPQYISLTKTQFNTSFIDAMTSDFATKKIAFSGTVNILLPELEEEKGQHEFKEIVTSDKANGAIISAITGLINRNKIIYVDKYSHINTFFDILVNNKYNVLIDTGAFFKDLTSQQFIELLAQYTLKVWPNKKYVFLDTEDNKLVYDQGKIYRLGETVFTSDEIFIFYDNKHIIGTDIKQPYHLNCCATINWDSILTIIAQGCFRVRNINYGHLIDFLIDTSVTLGCKLLRNTVDLLKFLYQNEAEQKDRAVKAFLLQNIKYLIRHKDHSKRNYTDTVFYEIIKSEDDLTKNLYQEYLKEHYCYAENKLLAELCSKLFDRTQTTNTKLETQQQKEVIVEKEQEIAELLAKVTIKRSDDRFSFKIEPSEYKAPINSYLAATEPITTADDKEGVTKEIYSLKYLKEKYNIYVSIYLINRIITANPNEPDKLLGTEYKDVITDKLDVFQNYNFYYIKILTDKRPKYVLIAPEEFFTLYMYLKFTNKVYNIVIKHKFGHIVYQDTNDTKDPQDLIVQMFLCKKLTYTDYLSIFDRIIADDAIEEFNALLFHIDRLYGYDIYKEDRVVDFFFQHRENYKTKLQSLCNKDNIQQLLQLLGFDIKEELTDSEKKVIIEQNELTNNDVIKCTMIGGSHKYKKYRLIKKIDNLTT